MHFTFVTALIRIISTRMHSSRMCTTRNSSRLLGRRVSASVQAWIHPTWAWAWMALPGPGPGHPPPGLGLDTPTGPEPKYPPGQIPPGLGLDDTLGLGLDTPLPCEQND